jgi:hypothetical protein
MIKTNHSFLTFDPSITQVALHSHGNVFPLYLVKEESKNLVPPGFQLLTNGHFILLRWSCTLRDSDPDLDPNVISELKRLRTEEGYEIQILDVTDDVHHDLLQRECI